MMSFKGHTHSIHSPVILEHFKFNISIIIIFLKKLKLGLQIVIKNNYFIFEN